MKNFEWVIMSRETGWPVRDGTCKAEFIDIARRMIRERWGVKENEDLLVRPAPIWMPSRYWEPGCEEEQEPTGELNGMPDEPPFEFPF